MKRLILLLSLIVAPAFAQQQELTFKFTPAETDIVWEALREMPVKKVEALMFKMRQQVQEQTKPTEPKQEEKK